MYYFFRLLLSTFLCLVLFKDVYAQPTGFVDELYLNVPNKQFVGFIFDDAGRIIAWEKSGKIWVIKEINNVPTLSPQPMLDLSAEVHNYGDLGLIGVVLDPNFGQNGFIYGCYALKPSILSNNLATILRVVRYTTPNPSADFPIATPSSKLTLLGSTVATGAPLLSPTHMGGGLAFGTDGSLLVAIGDGADYLTFDNGNAAYWEEGVNRGIISAAHNIGSNRAQVTNSLSGKVIRIDPTTGYGLPNNPYYNSSNPASVESKVWAKGLRNPWKIKHIPNTGSHSGDPGKFMVADVGSAIAEEINVLGTGGQNFGWPYYEGMNYDWSFLRPPTYLPSTWNKPVVAYRNDFRGYRNDSILVATSSGNLPNNLSGVEDGSSVLVGGINNKKNYPVSYDSTFFFADYGNKKIYYYKYTNNYEPRSIYYFSQAPGNVFGLDFNPIKGELFYLFYDSQGGNARISRIKYSPGNQKPIAVIEADTTNGDGVLTVHFSAKKSYDTNVGNTLTYSWNFGDGTTAVGLEPFHTFKATGVAEQNFNVVLTVTDNLGLFSKDSVVITLNNTAPQIQAVSIGNNNPLVPESQSFNALLFANVIDKETPTQLTYNWDVYLAHNGHKHLLESHTGNNINVEIPPISCEIEHASYWLQIDLKVTDPSGLGDIYTRILYPNCGGTQQTITFPAIPNKFTTDNSVVLSATATSNLPIAYFVIEGPAAVLGNSLTLLGIPGKVIVRATQHGNASFNEAKPEEKTFYIYKNRMNQTVTFTTTIPNQLSNSLPITLSAISSLGKPVGYVVMSGPAIVQNGQLVFTGGSGYVNLRAFSSGDDTTNGAYADLVFYVCANSLVLTSPTGNLTNTEKEFYSNSTINSTVEILGNSRVKYNAETYILLNPGFKVDKNAVFETSFEGCPEN